MKSMCYLAMTAEEIAFCPRLPEKAAWMACHFSPYGLGLTNLPEKMPAGSMLILNDRIPIRGHDPEQIAHELNSLRFDSLLLDFQRLGSSETMDLVVTILKKVPCPVAVTEAYAAGLDCPVFLPPVPTDSPPEDSLSKWGGREIWLDVSPGWTSYAVRETGTESISPTIPGCSAVWHKNESLFCHYSIETSPDSITFTLRRTQEDTARLLTHARELGVVRGVGLYQEWESLPDPVKK